MVTLTPAVTALPHPLTPTLMPTDTCPLPTVKMLLPDADTGLTGTAPVWRGHSPGVEGAQPRCGVGTALVWRGHGPSVEGF